jgi:hypothetical protein
MARKSYTRKTSRGGKIQPAVQTLSFATGSPGAGNTEISYIDLSQVASLANRRFYRQGINWAVAGIKVLSLQPGAVNCFKLPNTWIMSNAWEKGFRVWQKMNDEAISESGSIRPKFLDFKVYADETHHAMGSASNLLPVAPFGSATVPGEWDYSTYEIPRSDVPGTTSTRDVVAVGPNLYGTPSPVTGNYAVSLIEGYAASRALPNIEDPNTPDDASSASGALAQNWQTALFNDGTTQDAEVIENLLTENNIAPYPFENDGVNFDTMYPGGANQMRGMQWHDSVQIYSSSGVSATGIGAQRIKGGNFPCGLIRIDWTPDETNANLILQVDLVPGNHRGYLCEPMTEM